MLLSDRISAGRALAERLAPQYASCPDLLVLALPRGGVPVAGEIADALNAELDLMLVRKLGAPGQPELALGAIASGGVRLLNEDLIRMLGLTSGQLDAIAAKEQQELESRERAYRGERPPPRLQGRRIILVDDGVATGATMRAAIAAVHRQAPTEVVVAIPLAPPDTLIRLREEADRVLCLHAPEPFYSIGQWYDQFEQLTDEEVRRLLVRGTEQQRARQAA